ncbi:hypothetical protein [Hymenobacter terrigena]
MVKASKFLLYNTLLLSSCSLDSQPKTEHLTEHYYTGLSVDGEPGLYFDDPKLGMVYLRFATYAGINKGYVAACGDSCYILPVAASTVEAARHGQVVFLTQAAWKQEIFRLTGDSVKVESLL